MESSYVILNRHPGAEEEWKLDSRVFPAEAQPGEMTLDPYSNSGSYFTYQQRNTNLYQWAQTVHWRPLEAAGRHLLKAGCSYAYSSYNGQVSICL